MKRSLEYECIIQARKRNIISKFEILYDGQCAYVVTGERAAIAMMNRLYAKICRDMIKYNKSIIGKELYQGVGSGH